jgi:hypothetical protein
MSKALARASRATSVSTSAAINSDWRNRTEHCDVWKALYEWMEAELLAQGMVPLSLLAVRKTIEEKFIERWTLGKNATIGDVLAECKDTALIGAPASVR